MTPFTQYPLYILQVRENQKRRQQKFIFSTQQQVLAQGYLPIMIFFQTNSLYLVYIQSTMNVLIFSLLLCIVACSSGRTVYTQVTYMYDIKRGELGTYNRPYTLYLSYFQQMLQSDANLIIFGNKQLEEFVWKRRRQQNTVFVQKNIDQYHNYWYYPFIVKLRDKFLKDPNFPNKEHPQFALSNYNAIMFAKFYLLYQSLKYDKFNTDILIWSDGGYMHIFPRNLASPENVIKKYHQLLQAQWIFFTYRGGGAVLTGYQKGQFRYIDRKVGSTELSLAGHMGGYIQFIKDIKSAFENFLRITLENGDMNSDESVVTLMAIRFPFLIPTTTNIYLDDFVNRFHIYQDINRVEKQVHHLVGRFDEKSNLLITKQSAIDLNQSRIQINKVNDVLVVAPLKKMQQMISFSEILPFSYLRIKQLLQKKLSIVKGMRVPKMFNLAIVLLAYMIIMILNVFLEKKIYKLEQSGRI